MKKAQAIAAAYAAVSANPGRPATALLHDHADVRIVVFRIEPGQAVPVHTSTSTVILNVLEGRAILGGRDGEAEFATGDVACFEPEEPHNMRPAGDATLILQATITPRPGAR